MCVSISSVRPFLKRSVRELFCEIAASIMLHCRHLGKHDHGLFAKINEKKEKKGK